MAVRLNSLRKGVSILWDGADSSEITVYATGEDGDVHNKAPQANSGEAGLFYPADFAGDSVIEIRAADGTVIDSGTVSVS